jgi:hypothetical protein
MDKLPHCYFSWIVSFQKLRYEVYARCFVCRRNNPRVNYSAIRTSGGGGVHVSGNIRQQALEKQRLQGHEISKRNATWIGDVLLRNCLL